MSLSSYKITGDAVARSGVVAAPDKLTGTAAQNKAVFDRLVRETVSELFNGLIDALAGEDGAAEIGTSAISGVAGGDVQSVLGSIKTILDAKMATADAAAALSLKSDKSVTDLHIKSVALDAATGVFTFTREDGTYTAIDTALEKVATNWRYDADAQSLVLTLADGSTQTVPLSAFITETEFADSDQLAFSVSNHTVTATVKAGSITDTMLSSALLAQLRGCVTSASDSATDAAQSASAAELYRTQAAGSASTATTKASDASASATAAAGSATTAALQATSAQTSAGIASTKAGDAADSAEDSEAWAVGKRDGTDVPSTDPTYHNNAKYWSEQAAAAAGGGVTSFNGRTGAVSPQSGDYTAATVGADPAGSAAAAQAASTPVVGKGINLLDNWYFIGGGSQQGGDHFPINQRARYVVPAGTTFYSDTALTTRGGMTSAYTQAYYVDGTYGTVNVRAGTTYYVAWSEAVPGYVGRVYGFDRWETYDATAVLTQNGLNLTTNKSLGFFSTKLQNLIEGETYTLSVLYDNNKLRTGTFQFHAAASWVVIFDADADGWYSNYRTDNGITTIAILDNQRIRRTITIQAAKLELGNAQTLARNIGTTENPNWILNDPPPDFQQELAKCQRYYRIYATQALRPSNALDCNPPMRINPTQGTIDVNGTTCYYNDADL